MASWRPVFNVVLPIMVLICVLLGSFLFQPVWLFHREEIRVGNEVVSLVEAFRTTHSYLPERLKDIGVNEADLNVFYRKVSDQEYEVWFGTSVGESKTYNSLTKKWE